MKTMTQPGPLDTVSNLTAAINRGNLTALLKFFEENAVLVVQALAERPAQIARGKKVDRAGVSSDVLRKQSDGRWLVLIYNPYGTSIVGG